MRKHLVFGSILLFSIAILGVVLFLKSTYFPEGIFFRLLHPEIPTYEQQRQWAMEAEKQRIQEEEQKEISSNLAYYKKAEEAEKNTPPVFRRYDTREPTASGSTLNFNAKERFFSIVSKKDTTSKTREKAEGNRNDGGGIFEDSSIQLPLLECTANVIGWSEGKLFTTYRYSANGGDSPEIFCVWNTNGTLFLSIAVYGLSFDYAKMQEIGFTNESHKILYAIRGSHVDESWYGGYPDCEVIAIDLEHPYQLIRIPFNAKETGASCPKNDLEFDFHEFTFEHPVFRFRNLAEQWKPHEPRPTPEQVLKDKETWHAWPISQ